MAFVCSELLALREELTEVSAAAASAHSSGAETSRLSESLAAAEKQLQAAKNRIDQLEEEVSSIEESAAVEVGTLPMQMAYALFVCAGRLSCSC